MDISLLKTFLDTSDKTQKNSISTISRSSSWIRTLRGGAVSVMQTSANGSVIPSIRVRVSISGMIPSRIRSMSSSEIARARRYTIATRRRHRDS